jgi:hypothetical protein
MFLAIRRSRAHGRFQKIIAGMAASAFGGLACGDETIRANEPIGGFNTCGATATWALNSDMQYNTLAHIPTPEVQPK